MKVGQKVICVEASIKSEHIFTALELYSQWIKKGEKYTIRAILDNDDIVPGILLEEIVNPPVYIDLIKREQEPAFGLFRFREIDEEDIKAINSMEEIVTEIFKL